MKSREVIKFNNIDIRMLQNSIKISMESQIWIPNQEIQGLKYYLVCPLRAISEKK